MAGLNWNGHLPQTKVERDMFLAIEGCEDEDGNPLRPGGFVATEEGPTEVVRPRRHNTGPKGVIEDAKQASDIAKMQRQAEAAYRQELARQQSLSHQKAAGGQEAKSDDEDEDDEAFKMYRMQRLKQAEEEARKYASLPVFGELQFISQAEYVDCIDSEGASTFVVVHLYEEFMPQCVRLNFRLEALAKKYDHVKFVAIVASEAKETFDSTILPALVAYQAGSCVSNQLRIHDQVGEELPLQVLEELLQRMGVRLTSSVALSARDTAALQRHRECADSDADDDEEEVEADDDDDDDDYSRVVRYM